MSTQITAESILLDAYSNRDKPLEKLDQTIQDLDELRSFQLTKRKEFEQQLNKNRLNFGQWLRYARWEIDHNQDYRRARSIYERALQVNIEHVPFWTQYIQFELTHKNVNHARNLLERAVTTLPRVDKFWYLYIQTEEKLGNYEMVGVIFERWLTWYPGIGAWDSYALFNRRYEQYQKVREIYRRLIERIQEAEAMKEIDVGDIWLKWIQFEISVDEGYVRSIFENAVDNMIVPWRKRRQQKDGGGVDGSFGKIVDKWTRWEVANDEPERGKAIYEVLIKMIKDHGLHASDIYQLYSEFEKTYGTKSSIENTIYSKRLIRYKEELQNDPFDYDTWWSYIKLQQQMGNQCIEYFEEAISYPPKDTSKKTIPWKRYIFLWIYYAYYTEFELKDIESSRNIWQRTLKIMPHKKGGFTFGKVWIAYAEFEIRNNVIETSDLAINTARKIFGRSIGVCATIGKPKQKIIKYYIELEKKLGEWDRCRKLYEKWLELSTGSEVLLEYIEYERSLGEDYRCVALFEIGILLILVRGRLWQEYINFYNESLDYENSRKLYRRIIEEQGSESASGWISLAMFESKIPTADQLRVYEESGEEELEFSITDVQRDNSRAVFKEALQALASTPEQRIVVLEAWKNYEENQGTASSVEDVKRKLPTLVTRRKVNADGIEEEHVDYIFPEDEKKKPGINKFLENAKKWKLQQAAKS